MVKFPSHRHVFSFDERDHILENDVMDKTHSLAQHYDRYSFIATAFFMTYTCSSDYEIMQLPNTGGTLSVLSNVTT